MEDLLPALRAILGIVNDGEDALLRVLLSQSEASALALTGRTELPEGLRGAVVDMAVIRYNRRGLEGETERAEGSVTSRMEALPEDIRRQLRQYALARTGVKRCGSE